MFVVICQIDVVAPSSEFVAGTVSAPAVLPLVSAVPNSSVNSSTKSNLDFLDELEQEIGGGDA